MTSDEETLKELAIALQERLNHDFDAGLVVDGDAGKNTIRAVIKALGSDDQEAEAPSVEILDRALPAGCYSSRALKDPDGVCVHYVSACYSDPDNWSDVEAIRNQTIDLNRPKGAREFYPNCAGDDRVYASYHYLIDREGAVHRLAPLNKQAYHAGRSKYPQDDTGRTGCNSWSIGVALIADERDVSYTDDQYKSLRALVSLLGDKFTINHIFGHDECAPERKKDPGPLFKWDEVR